MSGSAAGDGSEDQEWLAALCDGVGESRVQRLVADVGTTGEEADERATLTCGWIAEGVAQGRVGGFEGVNDGVESDRLLDGQPDGVVAGDADVEPEDGRKFDLNLRRHSG